MLVVSRRSNLEMALRVRRGEFAAADTVGNAVIVVDGVSNAIGVFDAVEGDVGSGRQPGGRLKAFPMAARMAIPSGSLAARSVICGRIG